MPKDHLILPRADSGCGKAFYSDRRIADGHRIALEFWNRATGCVRDGYQLTVHRCNRCGGFHISQRRIEKLEFEIAFVAHDTADCRGNPLDSESVMHVRLPLSCRKRRA